jgi:hypothetical protein
VTLDSHYERATHLGLRRSRASHDTFENENEKFVWHVSDSVALLCGAVNIIGRPRLVAELTNDAHKRVRSPPRPFMVAL